MLYKNQIHNHNSFSGDKLETHLDLDGEMLTPVTFPGESAASLTEVEQEALESGDDIRSFQSRYHHIPASQVAIIPASTLLTIGGKLKNLAVFPQREASIRATAEARRAYESMRYQVILEIDDDDAKTQGSLRRELVYNFPPQYARTDEISLNQKPVTARFKLIPLTPQ